MLVLLKSTIQCIIVYIVLSVLYKCRIRTLARFGRNVSAAKVSSVKQEFIDSLNLNCSKQDPTTTGTCGKLITSLYCIGMFVINV